MPFELVSRRWVRWVAVQAHAATGTHHTSHSNHAAATYRSATLERLLAQQQQWAPGEIPTVDAGSPLADYLLRPLPSQRCAPPPLSTHASHCSVGAGGGLACV